MGDLLTTADGHEVGLGARVFNYYDRVWVTITRMPEPWDDGWADVTDDAGRVKSLNGERMAMRDPR